MKNKHVNYLKYCICCGRKTEKDHLYKDLYRSYTRLHFCLKCDVDIVYSIPYENSNIILFAPHHKQISFSRSCERKQFYFRYDFYNKNLESFNDNQFLIVLDNCSLKEAFNYIQKYFNNLEFI